MSKVALAFSGGLDTLICIDYLKRRKNLQVITFSGNVGQEPYLEPIGEKSIELGTQSSHVADLRVAFAEEFILPAIRAQAEYGRGYYLGAALVRPLIARELVRIAREEGCKYLAHGCRGKGNDRLRFERCFNALAPELDVISPLAELGVDHPGDDIEYARKTSIPLESATETIYNVEENLWGTNIQLTPFKDEWEEAPSETYIRTVPPEKAPSRRKDLELRFEEGRPVALDGDRKPLPELLASLNRLGGKFGVGRFDVIENRLVDHKTREIHEQPAATLINTAYRALEELVQDQDVMDMKSRLSRDYGQLIYNGKWFTDEREGFDRFFRRINGRMTGDVRLRMTGGLVRIAGRKADSTCLDRDSENLDIAELRAQFRESSSSASRLL